MMLTSPLIALALGVLASAPALALPHGDQRFRLGMSRAEVDSAVASRGLTVLSNTGAYLVCASDDSTAEYEQYSFYQAPHGMDFLWKVLIGYRLDATLADYALVREQLRNTLGEPTTDSWGPKPTPQPGDPAPEVTAQRALWVDPATSVQLGARWTGAPDASADRMKVCWTDRRLQRLVEAHHKKDRVPKPQ